MDVGFVGLGSMGRPMAVNLAAAGHRVRAWNRSAVDPAEVPGVALVDGPDAAFRADAVLTMLADDAAVRAVLLDGGVLERAGRDVVHVNTATISVAFAEELAGRHAALGIAYVAAPVFGRPDAAAARQLNVVAAGDPAAVARVQPLFDAIGRRTWPVGARPAQANAVKIAGNMMLPMAIEAMAEACVVAGVEGVAKGDFLDLMLGTLFAGRAYESYGANIRDDAYDPKFKMTLGLKDLRLAAELAGERDLPMLAAVRGRMQAAADAGFGERDWSAMAAYTLGQRP